MPNLFPTFNLPTLAISTAPKTKRYYQSPSFDFETGDFLVDNAGRFVFADGRETFEQWCLKVCMTERGTRLAYSDKIGTEFEAAIHFTDPAAVKSSIIRTISESILVHPAAEYVKNFQFKSEGDELQVSFDVKGRDFDDASRLTVTY